MNNIDSLFCPDIMNKPTSTEGRPKKATSGFFSEGNGSVARIQITDVIFGSKGKIPKTQ